jgi:phage terminase large subunit-like protein
MRKKYRVSLFCSEYRPFEEQPPEHLFFVLTEKESNYFTYGSAIGNVNQRCNAPL